MLSLKRLTGSKAHLWQRISAIYLLLYIPLMALYIAFLPETNSLENIVGNLLYYCFFGYLSIVAYLLLLVHVWIGGRDILIDYIPRNRLTLWLNLYYLLLIVVTADLLALIVSVNPYL
ncbi:succinate dehydrogenase, hydrophobic membrane anchor protein [Thiomicrorhabdus xiamenensis]|uniref:Succinate dehydrogenase hydrophobic membrane anchor subunit n=1 Tax=Thiomicrorhabdus xiamenensis TaxID=2739063 RepID=A0A7D4TAG1_9GAMM|nr:succinate dehydrogenase, hydrophobic membrane anchor protein [Thiomicrorhabdus xiamenensis]QKI89086.1 succinate dehydrogenase, hydrophobic membrane anchor protein [Thiomicrorhabdus xiamenensis]